MTRWTLEFDFSKARTSPVVALRFVLKILLRTFGARCTAAKIEDAE